MSTPIHANATGTFVSDGTSFNLSLPCEYDKFDMYNISNAANNNGEIYIASGMSSMPAGSAYVSAGNGATLDTAGIAANGFTFFSDSVNFANGAPRALNGVFVNQADPALVGTANTADLVANTSVVRLISTTNMLQIAGMDFTIGAINAGVSFTLRYLSSDAFAAAANAGSYRIINADSRYYPRSRYITSITRAARAVVKLSVIHNYTIGQKVRVIIPNSNWGMTEINNLLGTIVASDAGGADNTITLDIDSTAFTAFRFPTSVQRGTFAQIVPVGEAAVGGPDGYANLLDDATHNASISGITIGSDVQTNGISYQWVASNGVEIA